MHRRIVEPVLENLDKDRAGYFVDIVTRAEEDPRTQHYPNLVFQLLRETIPLLPSYLEKTEFLDAMYLFLQKNQGAMKRKMFSPEYARRPEILQEVTGHFVNAIVDRTLAQYDEGDIDTGELTHMKYTWPYRAEDLVDPDDEDAVEELKSRASYTGPERRKPRD